MRNSKRSVNFIFLALAYEENGWLVVYFAVSASRAPTTRHAPRTHSSRFSRSQIPGGDLNFRQEPSNACSLTAPPSVIHLKISYNTPQETNSKSLPLQPQISSF